MNINLQALNNFIGYGNPNSLLWFIGIDEQGDFDIKEENNELSKLAVFTECFKNFKGKPFYILEEDLISRLPDTQMLELKEKADRDFTYKGILEIFNVLNKSKYTGSFISNSQLKLFDTNLFPIGRGNTSNDNYGSFVKKYFDISTFSEWKQGFWNDRIQAFNEFIIANEVLNSPKIFICLGVGYQTEFQEVLKIIFDKEIKLIKHQLVTINDEHQAILCYHPSKRNRSNKFTKIYVSKILEELQKSPLLMNIT